MHVLKTIEERRVAAETHLVLSLLGNTFETLLPTLPMPVLEVSESLLIKRCNAAAKPLLINMEVEGRPLVDLFGFLSQNKRTKDIFGDVLAGKMAHAKLYAQCNVIPKKPQHFSVTVLPNKENHSTFFLVFIPQ